MEYGLFGDVPSCVFSIARKEDSDSLHFSYNQGSEKITEEGGGKIVRAREPECYCYNVWM